MAASVYSTSNLDEPLPVANRQSTILGVCITMLALSWICTTARLYVRLRIIKSVGWDDFFVALYLVTTTVGVVAISLATNYGLGKHWLLLSSSTYRMYLIFFYIANLCYVMSSTFVKLSLLFQYLRIFGKGTTIRRYTIALIVIIATWGFAYSFMAVFPCFPVRDYWDLRTTSGSKCYLFGSRKSEIVVASFESHTASNMVFDALVLTLPVPLYFEKETPKKAKHGLLALLFMGCLVNVFAIWRLGTILQNQAGTFPVEDPTWYGPISIILAVLEVGSASICGSVPVFWPVLSQQFGKIFVTKEFIITVESRVDHANDTHNSRRNSTSLDPEPGLQKQSSWLSEKQMATHYDDFFIRSQVDPLARTGQAAVQSKPAKPTRKWMKF